MTFKQNLYGAQCMRHQLPISRPLKDKSSQPVLAENTFAAVRSPFRNTHLLICGKHPSNPYCIQKMVGVQGFFFARPRALRTSKQDKGRGAAQTYQIRARRSLGVYQIRIWGLVGWRDRGRRKRAEGARYYQIRIAKRA